MPVLLVHGAGGTPSDLLALGRDLHRRGHTCFCPLLPAHGLGTHELAGVKFERLVEFVFHAYDELRRTGPEPYVVGQSLGGVLSIHLAAARSLPGLVALAPALRPMVATRALWLIPLSIFNPRLAQSTYRWQMEVRRGIERTRELVPDVTCRLLVIHSDDDRSVSIRGAEELHARAASSDKRFEIVSGQGHVLSEAPEKERLVFEPIARFLSVAR